MPAPLSPYAAGLLVALTDTANADESAARWPDLSQVTDEEVGTLFPATYRLPNAPHPAAGVRSSVQMAMRNRQPRFTPQACLDLIDALAGRAAERRTANPVLAVVALLRCTGDWPELSGPAGKLVNAATAHGSGDQPYAVLAMAGLAGPVRRTAVAALLKARSGTITGYEIDALLDCDHTSRAWAAEVADDRPYDCPDRLVPEGWWKLADQPAYRAYAERALRAANTRVAEIHSGVRAFVADKAFTRDECVALGRAVRVALVRDEPWLPELLDQLLPAVAVAPTSASTVPSQALLYEVLRAAEDVPTPEVLAALRAARAVVRHKGVQKQLDRRFRTVERGLANRPEVAFRLPDLGFESDGVLRREVAGHQAVLTVAEDVELVWHRPDGRPATTVPAAVRRDAPDQLAELKSLVKRARGHLTALARAIEAGYCAEVVWPYRRWRETLAGPVLARAVAGRLIWELEVAPGSWRAGLPGEDLTGFHDPSGAALPEPGPDTGIRLWHPIRAGVEEISAWRDELTRRRVRQPFKQAFREIHLLTPAERETGHYSNRFAAHIVAYRQFYALVRGRGWTTGRLGPWDGGDTTEASGMFADGRWRARLQHDYRWDDQTGEYASTDQVRFDRLDGGWRETALSEVPTLVFSEAMRDVELFVSVTSIAGDATWVDRGDDRHLDYWQGTAFGDLTAVGQTRRAALERIIPATTIADRCRLDGRYLVVRGDLRTYRIHLGSGNILIEPDDRYLCIVPSARGAGERLFLPFSDDRLALILSKAFLLAADASIKDRTIREQLERAG